MTSIDRQANRITARLAWQRPLALWLLPLIFLFLTTTLPLLAEGGGGVSSLTVTMSGLTSLIMAFILVHHFFGFVHHLEKNDFYLALPASRSKLFFTLNASALSYLIGPSLVIMGLNSLLVLAFGQDQTQALSSYARPLSSLWPSYAGLILHLIYLFFLLELFYLITEKASRALASFVLINLFWPLLLFFYSDASSRFLPGLINPLTTATDPSPWLAGLLQLFSPALFFLGSMENYPLLTGLMAAVLAILTYLAFRNRKADYAPGETSVNWPFELTQWMGIMSLTLLAGYAAHYLRELTTETDGFDTNLKPASPIPFLIGSLLGLLLSLWIFNLLKGKGRLVWRAFPLTLAITAIPFIAWLAVVMSGAGNFSTHLPPAQAIDRVRIHYSDSYAPANPSLASGAFTFELTEARDLALFSRLYEKVLTEANPGLALPRTLSSQALSTDFVRRMGPSGPLDPDDPDKGGYYYGWHPETHFTLLGKDGKTYPRLMLLPQTFWNGDYLALLKANRRFYLAELSQYNVQAKLQVGYSLQVTDQASSQDRETWIDPLKAMTEGENMFFYGTGLEELAGRIAGTLALESDDRFDQLQKTAPALILVQVDLSGVPGFDPADFQLLLPLDPDRIEGLDPLIENYVNLYEEIKKEEAYKEAGREELP